MLSTGKDNKDCFDLIETADKADHIALELKRVSGKMSTKTMCYQKQFYENL